MPLRLAARKCPDAIIRRGSPGVATRPRGVFAAVRGMGGRRTAGLDGALSPSGDRRPRGPVARRSRPPSSPPLACAARSDWATARFAPNATTPASPRAPSGSRAELDDRHGAPPVIELWASGRGFPRGLERTAARTVAELAKCRCGRADRGVPDRGWAPEPMPRSVAAKSARRRRLAPWVARRGHSRDDVSGQPRRRGDSRRDRGSSSIRCSPTAAKKADARARVGLKELRPSSRSTAQKLRARPPTKPGARRRPRHSWPAWSQTRSAHG